MDHLRGITREEYERDRFRRFGEYNGMRMDVPLWQNIVRSHPRREWQAAGHFGDGADYVESKPRWSFDRFGMSCTLLAVNQEPLTHLWIGGEHEDSCDPYFCIYNDVILTRLDGTVEINGYPRDVFPPTDFHTATHTGDRHESGSVYIIGRLGYAQDRILGTTPVYRLDLDDMQIGEVHVPREEPSWLHEHGAMHLPGLQSIAVWGGYTIDLDGERRRNEQSWLFNLKSHTWNKIDNVDLRHAASRT